MFIKLTEKYRVSVDRPLELRPTLVNLDNVSKFTRLAPREIMITKINGVVFDIVTETIEEIEALITQGVQNESEQ